MKIALVAEGSYPYISGGVSTWMHSLIESNPSIDFTILAILPASSTEKDRVFKYRIPENVDKVETYFIGESSDKEILPSLQDEQIAILQRFFLSKANAEELFSFVGDTSIFGSVSGFFASRQFWEIVQYCYEQEQYHSSFIDYFWMIRNKYEPIFTLLQSNIQEKFDLIHAASTGYAGVFGAYISYQQHIPYVLTEHGIYSREREEEILQSSWVPTVYKSRWISYFHYLSSIAYNQATTIVSLFEKNADIQRQIGAPSNKIAIIGNGVHLPDAPVPTPVATVDKLLIGAIVRVVPIKDILTMLQSAYYMKERGIPFHLYIFGPMEEDPAYAKECEESLRELGLEEYVTFTGKINVAEWIPKMDVFLLTSISEGQPMAILEGMSYRKPFIATNVGDTKRLLTEGGKLAGFVVPPVEPTQIADAVETYFNNPLLLSEHGQNGYERVQANHQLSTIMDKYAEIYHTLGGK